MQYEECELKGSQMATGLEIDDFVERSFDIPVAVLF